MNKRYIIEMLFDKFCPCLTHKNMRINELTSQDMRDIEQGLEDIKNGLYTTTKELKEKLGL